jgi:hypothetical protein
VYCTTATSSGSIGVVPAPCDVDEEAEDCPLSTGVLFGSSATKRSHA